MRASSAILLTTLQAAGSCFLAAAATVDIKVDQVGYLPAGPKLAMVTHSSGSRSGFVVKRSSNHAVVFRGKLGNVQHDSDSADDVRSADFSALRETGHFYLDVPGVGRSWEFSINADVYRPVYYLAMRSYYGQRCGTAVNLGPDFPGYAHGPCHLKGAFHASAGREGPHASSKGWHDAGDYGRYVVNSAVSTGTLLWTWELFGKRLMRTRLNIPESGHGTPDILSEIRWNLDWMLSMQDYDGGVFHKQTSEHFSGFIMPEMDDSVSYVIGAGSTPWKTSCATADTAAVAAIGSRAFRPFDPAYAEVLSKASKLAWQWLDRNPNVTFNNPPGISTGAYGDNDCSDERLWAAAELWRTTGDQIYSQYFLTHYQPFLPTIRAVNPQTWSSVAPMALWSYALATGGDPPAARTIQELSVTAAEQIAKRTSSHPYQVSLTTSDYVWGSNAVALNYSMQLLVADRFRPSATFIQAANDNLHYVLGSNTFSISWVTQAGEHAFLHPHHRPSAADGVNLPWPGLMSGGPNPGRQDEVMKKLVAPDTPPARAYVDETGAYACNEVAINWNAPLVFTLAGLLPEQVSEDH